jgi:hypothetical protein
MADGSRIKQLDGRVGEARELVKRSNDWFAERQTSLADHYMRGKMHLGCCRAFGEKSELDPDRETAGAVS